MTKIGYDNMQVDSLQVIEDSRCCLKVNAVITKEGVHQYPDGRAFKSRMELLKATHTARNAKITILDHPDSLVVMSQKQMHGIVEKPFFDRDRIRAVLNFDKSTCPPDFLDKVRKSQLKDVSIGFYYQPDMTPGKWNDSNYDYVMRDIVIDHVAAGVVKGRCSFPDCGIGVDTMMKRIALDPFGEYADFADCVAKNQDKADPEAYCATIKRSIEGAQQIRGGEKGLSSTKPTEWEDFLKDRKAQGYSEQQAKDYWDAYVAGTKELIALIPSVPPSTKPPETVAPPPTTPVQLIQPPAPGVKLPDVVPKPPEETAKLATPPPENLTSEQLIDRSKELLAMREQKVIEERRQDRRHPL
ncbi:DUF2213 domain-containing protein [Candidatus Bathyarchaeota archaeon]|nr:DUF2213 domain-containing protein [Candidatus Bathyarchaeota archaeon]